MGIISPVGTRLDDVWANICEGNSQIGPLDEFDTSSYPTRIAGTVKDFDADQYMSKKDQRKNDPFIHYGVFRTKSSLVCIDCERRFTYNTHPR